MHADKIYEILDSIPIITEKNEPFNAELLNKLNDIRLLVEDMNKEIQHVRRLAIWGTDY